MRITRELLLSTAKETVKRATYGSHDLVCVYITGSLIYPDPLIGGTTDIDMMYVHSVDAPVKREIVPITEEYHLDIAHLHQSAFSQPRSLRTDPWIGAFLCNAPIPIFDSGHWFEYIQAAVFSQFFQPLNVIQRVKPFAERARAGWISLQTCTEGFNPVTLYDYLKVMKNAANAITCLTSVPLTDRRFFIDYPIRTQELAMPGLSGGLSDLIVPADPIEPNWESWLADWRTDFGMLQKRTDAPLKYSNGRQAYYEKAIEGLKETNQQAALWILLWTWTEISAMLSPNGYQAVAYADFCRVLALGNDQLQNRVNSLDAYLDVVEESIERWSQQNGL
jgi:hypothetical protein